MHCRVVKSWSGLMVMMLTACTATLPPSANYPGHREQAAIQAALQSWQLAGLPWTETCRAEFARIRVVVSAPAEFTDLCGRPPVNGGGKLYACSTQQYEQQFPGNLIDRTQIPLLIISQLQPAEHRRLLMIHESMHWLERCSGKGIDYHHEDERVWLGARHVAQLLLRENDARVRYAAFPSPLDAHTVARR